MQKPSSWTDRISLSGKTYLRYTWQLDEAAGNANAFAIDRLYLQSEYRFTDRLLAQVTLEAGDLREGGGGPLDVVTKYLFFEAKDLGFTGTYLRVGQLPLAWVPYEEDLWGLRMQGSVFMDRAGYMTSTDLGIAFGGKLPMSYGSFQVDVGNGEGWKSPELFKRKAIEARLTVNPLASMGGVVANLFLSGFGYYGGYDNAGFTEHARQRYIGQVGYHDEDLTLAAEYAFLTDASAALSKRYDLGYTSVAHGVGFSAFGVLGLVKFSPVARGWDLFARFDHIDPETSVADNEVSTVIGGLGWRWNKHARTIVDFEANLPSSRAGGLTNAIVQAQMEIKL